MHTLSTDSGDDSIEDTPVPIPNTEVKLFCAEDTWRVTARENRSLPVYLRLHGQVVKTPPFHGGNPGSSPGGVTSASRTTRCTARFTKCADVVELADTQDLGSCGAIRVGSSPTIRTNPEQSECFAPGFDLTANSVKANTHQFD